MKCKITKNLRELHETNKQKNKISKKTVKGKITDARHLLQKIITAARQQMGDKMYGAQKCFSCLMKIDRWDDEKQGLIAH